MGLKGKTFRFNETLDLPVTAIQSEIDFLLTRMGRTCWKAYIAYNGGFTYYYGDRENWASSSIYGRTSGWTYAEDRVIKFMSNGDNADFETWVLANAVEIPSEIEVYTDENGVDHHFRDDSMPTLLDGKADKVSSPTSGNFAALDSNGNLTDSGSKASDFLTQHQDISGKVNGPSSAVNNQVAVFDGTTGKAIKDSGFTIGKSVPSDAVFTDTNTWRPIEGTTAAPSVDAAFSSIAGNALNSKIADICTRKTLTKQYATQVADAWEYIGLSITVPSGHTYILNVTCDWQIGKPLGLAIGTSSSGTPDIRYESNGTDSVMLTGAIFLQNGTYYVFAKRGAASQTQNNYTVTYLDIY